MTNKTKFSLIIAFVLVGAVVFGFFSGDDAAQPVAKQEAKMQDEKPAGNQNPLAPDFTLTDLDGDKVSLSSFRGKIVIIDFWATWCPPCRKGIPDFVQMQKEYGDDNLVVLGINVDQGDTPEAVKEKVDDFADDYKINYPVLFHNIEVVYAYGGIQSIPTTFILDKEGRVIQGFAGYRPMSYFKSIIDPLI